MSNYPEGSMRGSGIYSRDVYIEVECPECHEGWDDDFATDDWGNVDTTVPCPHCAIEVRVTSANNYGEDD